MQNDRWIPAYRFVVRPPSAVDYTLDGARRELQRFPWVRLLNAENQSPACGHCTVIGTGVDSHGYGTVTFYLVEGEIEIHCREYAMDRGRHDELREVFGDRFTGYHHPRYALQDAPADADKPRR